MYVSLKKLWSTDIPLPEGFEGLLKQLFPPRDGSILPGMTFEMQPDAPPVFFYEEWRHENGNLTNFSYYGGGGGSVAISFGSRHILELSSGDMRTNTRGKILDAFCKLDFVLEVMCCLGLGVFEGKMTYKTARVRLNGRGYLSTTEKRTNYLRDSNTISLKTYQMINKARKIRNVLAHQYLPHDYAINPADVKHYGGVAESVEAIYEGAWFHLLSDYNERQPEVAKWLTDKNLVIGSQDPQ